MMTLEALEACFGQPEPNPLGLAERLAKSARDSHDVQRVRNQMAIRLLYAVDAIKRNEASKADVIVLMRQVLRYFGRMRVNASWWTMFRARALESGVHTSDSANTNVVEIWAADWSPEWLSHAENIDALDN